MTLQSLAKQVCFSPCTYEYGQAMLKIFQRLISGLVVEDGLVGKWLEVLVEKLELHKLLYKQKMRQKPLFMVTYFFMAHKGMHGYTESCINTDTRNIDIDALYFKSRLIQIRLLGLQINLPDWLENKACQILVLKWAHVSGSGGGGGGGGGCGGGGVGGSRDGQISD